MPKDDEIDPVFLGQFVPGIVVVEDPQREWTLPSSDPSIPLVPMPFPGTSFIENYKLYFFMPTPFEQIGTVIDPMSVQDPPQRYLNNPWNIVFDLHADYTQMKNTVAPPPNAPPTMLDPRFFQQLVGW